MLASMQEAPALTPVVLSSLSGITSAVIAGLVTAAIKSRELNTQFENRKKEIAAQYQQQVLAERERTREEFLRDLVRPLAESAADLRQRFVDIQQRLDAGDDFVVKSLQEMKQRSEDRTDVEAFLASCAGGWHHYAATTLYCTALYLANAARYREPSRPLITDVAALDTAVERVRSDLGGEHALWTDNQDSIGLQMLGPDRRVMSFREFLERLVDQTEHKWYLRLLDAFWHVDSAETRAMLERGVVSLTALTHTAEASLRTDR
jgi:hypothetical protein